MCGGFTCTKNSLIGLNVLYMLVAFLLMGVAAYGRTSSVITSVPVVGGIVACGVFLLFIAVLGILGAVKHHQVLLFFYMLVLFLLFLIQFSVACACLAIDEQQQQKLAASGWRIADGELKKNAQDSFQCCGFNTTLNDGLPEDMQHPACPPACCGANQTTINCCMEGTACKCQPCYTQFHAAISSGIRASGGIGLFFSFTEFLGVWVASRYRNQKDPFKRSSFL